MVEILFMVEVFAHTIWLIPYESYRKWTGSEQVDALSTLFWMWAIDTRMQMSFTHDLILSLENSPNQKRIYEMIFSLEFIYFIIKQIYA